MSEINYSARLSVLKLYSFQCHRERTMWRIYNPYNRNKLAINFQQDRVRDALPTFGSIHIKNNTNNNFNSIGPALFNMIPE